MAKENNAQYMASCNVIRVEPTTVYSETRAPFTSSMEFRSRCCRYIREKVVADLRFWLERQNMNLYTIRLGLLVILAMYCTACCTLEVCDNEDGTRGEVENLKAVGDCGGITISWETIDGVESYSVRRSDDEDDTDPPEIRNVARGPVRDIPPERDKRYFYWVEAEGNITGPESAKQKALPSRPSRLNVEIRGSIVEVTWWGSTQDYDFQKSIKPAGSTSWEDGDIDKLRPAKRSADSGLFFKQVNNLPQPMRFRVRAVNECGSGPWTNWEHK